MSVSVRFWGVRGSIPSPGPETVRHGGNTSCVELRTPDQIIIFDAGSGIRRLGLALMKEAAGAPIAATLLLSHTHWDHIQGLPFFAPAYAPRSEISVLSANDASAKIARGLHHQMDPIHFPVSLAEMPGIARIAQLGSGATKIKTATIRHIALNHPGGCAGFRVESHGVVVAYLPDHEPYRFSSRTDAAAAQAELVNFIADADLLILDSQYDEVEYGSHRGWGHGCLSDTIALALAGGVAKVALFHHDPEHDDEKLDAMVARGRQIIADAGESLHLFAAAEGACVTKIAAPCSTRGTPIARRATAVARPGLRASRAATAAR